MHGAGHGLFFRYQIPTKPKVDIDRIEFFLLFSNPFLDLDAPTHLTHYGNGRIHDYVRLHDVRGLLNYLPRMLKSIDVFDEYGHTALYNASDRSDCEMVHILLQWYEGGLRYLHSPVITFVSQYYILSLFSGAAVNCSAPGIGRVPLHVACRRGHLETIRYHKYQIPQPLR